MEPVPAYKKVPNFYMLQAMLTEAMRVKERFPDLEQMPRGAICPGYDIKLMAPLAVLKYLYGVQTQWSCQGNHQSGTMVGYILLAPDSELPPSLKILLSEQQIPLSYVEDYDSLTNSVTGKFRLKASSVVKAQDISLRAVIQRNHIFLKVLNLWAREEVRRNLAHLPTGTHKDISPKNLEKFFSSITRA